MKKLLFFLFYWLFTISSLPQLGIGQSNAAGIHFGYGFSDLSDDDFYNRHGQSFMFGVFRTFRFTEKLSLQAEFNFDKRGDTEINVPLGSIPIYDTPYKFYYAGMPVLMQYSFGEKIRYVPAAGAAVHYLLLEKWNDIKQTSEYKKIDAGFMLSQQLQIRLGEAHFLKLEGRSYHGLIRAEKPDSMANYVGRHSSFLFVAGLGFILK
jgi:hypothetical protein